MAKDKHYRDFSNRKAFNNVPVGDDEELVPMVLTEEMKITLKPMGLDYKNVETWTFPYGKKVKVFFALNKKGSMDEYMKTFYAEVERYLKQKDEKHINALSLDKFLEDTNNDDYNGFDPTGTTDYDEKAQSLMILEGLIEDVEAKDANMGKIIRLLFEGFKKNEILKKVDLGKGKTQGYAFIEKTQKIALEIYNEKYRK